MQSIRVQSPLRGVNRAFTREAQPDSTVWDARNVLPFDRYNRLRVGQRPGLGLLTTLDNTIEVRLLHVASSANPNPGAGSLNFTKAASPEQLTDFEADAIANPGADAASLYTGIRGPASTYGFPIEANTPTANRTVLSNFGDGTFGMRQSSSVHTANPGYGYYLFPTAIGDSTTWLAASDAIWFEAIVHYEVLDTDPGVTTAPNFQIMFGIPVSELASTDGADVHPLIGFSFVAGGETIDTAGAAFDGATFPTLTELMTPVSYPYTNEQDYKLIVVVTATTINLFIDDFTTMTLVDQYALPTGLMTVANIIDGTATVSVQSTKDTTATTGPNADTVKSFAAYQAHSTPSSISRTILQLVATDGADTFVGQPTAMAKATDSATYPIDPNAIFVSAATLFGFTYIVDGNGKPKRLDLSDNTMIAFTEDAGTVQGSATIAASWRGRLLLSGVAESPQNVFASRAGDPLDWDYSQTDPAAAFALNAASSGKVGEPVHALIPISDDILLIGCEQSVFRIRGDPADGGACDMISNSIGVASSTSWCQVPDGSTYFVGPGGLFKASPDGVQIEPVDTTAYPQFFQDINHSTNYLNLIYDENNYGVWIFVAPLTDGVAATSMFYDLRIGKGDKLSGFWPQRFTHLTTAGPVSAVYWDGFDSDNRYPVLGGYAGGLYASNSTNRTDNGGAIDASIVLGPFHPSEGANILSGTTFDFGELSAADSAVPDRWQASVILQAGKTAYDVTEGTPTGTVLVGFGRDRRTKTIRQKLRGEWFTVEISNSAASNYFSLESVELEFEPAGRNRRQR